MAVLNMYGGGGSGGGSYYPKLRLAISNGGEVVSVGERQIRLAAPSRSGTYPSWDLKPMLDINMTLSVEKVFSRNEVVTVEGLMEHMYKSKGEAWSTQIRFKEN